MKPQEYNNANIDKSKLCLATGKRDKHDAKLSTKPVGYMTDAWRRFKKNKASVFSAIIILLLIIYSIVGPFMINSDYTEAYAKDKYVAAYKNLLPKVAIMEGTGIWDGTQVLTVNESTYYKYMGIEQETGYEALVDTVEMYQEYDKASDKTRNMYVVRVDSYYSVSAITPTVSEAQYQQMIDWQTETGIQLFLPRVSYASATFNDTDVWYLTDGRGNAILDAEGNLQPSYVTAAPGTSRDDYTGTRIEGDDGTYVYANRSGKAGAYNYEVRVSAYEYFQYRYGFEPTFAFGTDALGRDIFSRLASGARFSFILAVGVSVINLTLGAIYGAIEGYYGGIIDMGMERFSDILNGVPFMVVTVLFQLHLANKVGVVGALVYAFILTGWIGMASSVRMQFYRFKNQEYVLAARTLGASDGRIMFKHIFPNALGTLITGCVLVIPGVIFSETSLSYLGIINLNSATMSSIGSMLNVGAKSMTTSPHIVLFPAIFIGLLMVCFNLFGNGLRDAFNPSLRGTEE